MVLTGTQAHGRETIMLSMIPNAAYAHQLARHATNVEKSTERISSGTQLNFAHEDPADFAMAEAINRQGSAAKEVIGVIQDGINVLRIGQDGVRGIMDVLQSLREVVVRAGNGAMHTPEDQAILQEQLDTQKGLLAQAFVAAKNFRVRLDGLNGADRILHFQVGTGSGEVMTVDYNPLREALRDVIIKAFGYEELYNNPDMLGFLDGLGISPAPLPTDVVPPPPFGPAVPPGTTWAEAYPRELTIDPPNQANLGASFSLLDTALSKVVAEESYLGSCALRMEDHLSVMQTFELNMAASESAIRDTDMAAESAKMTKEQVLQQAAQAMLAQANSRALQVLELLRQP